MKINWKKGKIECCGLHETCEHGLHEKFADKNGKSDVEYYDDEELDVFAGQRPDSYAEEEIDMFREVLNTMRDADVKGWLHSLKHRGIALPKILENRI
ncbi:MAG: hypothetical protein LBF79_04605 [Dysgonamonadaceae bacterium]|nr:hypothetical protein [Dysgonamonadaceae bacterium]